MSDAPKPTICPRCRRDVRLSGLHPLTVMLGYDLTGADDALPMWSVKACWTCRDALIARIGEVMGF